MQDATSDPSAQPEGQPEGATMETSEFASLLKKEFKPRTKQKREAVENKGSPQFI